MTMRCVSSCKTYNYGDSRVARYVQEGESLFNWYQRYSALLCSPVLVVGCGNAVMSEDMAKDGYEGIMNIGNKSTY